jgi:hypothetical protein
MGARNTERPPPPAVYMHSPSQPPGFIADSIGPRYVYLREPHKLEGVYRASGTESGQERCATVPVSTGIFNRDGLTDMGRLYVMMFFVLLM